MQPIRAYLGLRRGSSMSDQKRGIFGHYEEVHVLMRMLAFVQNAVSAVLIFFALLAIRNYFKLG